MEVGDTFPDFVLTDENGEKFDSRFLNGIRHIVYFYPKDSTPGCTQEAIDFNGVYDRLMIRNVPVLGISRDSAASHKKFMENNGLKIKLLTDKDHELMSQVGAWGLKKAYGKETEGVIRSTFVIGKDGKIEAVWYNVKVAGHVDTVYATVKSIMK